MLYSSSHGYAENRCIELHSPDGIHSCILRASDSQEALAWFNALHSAMARSTQRALQDANRALSNIIGELKHIGWLSRRVGNEQVSRYLLPLQYCVSAFLRSIGPMCLFGRACVSSCVPHALRCDRK